MEPFEGFYARNPGVNLPDVFADVREAFSRLEAAISLAETWSEPDACRHEFLRLRGAGM
jgi:hypothetical protein